MACGLVEDVGTVRLVDIDLLRVDAWLAPMRRRGVGAGVMQGRVSTPKAAASWGVSRRMLRSNPVVDAAPRVRNGRRSVRPEPEQVVALLRAATEESRRAGLALRLAALTGAREAEIVALAWDDQVGDTPRPPPLGGEHRLRDGHDPVTVAARLGHSPGTLLRIYAQEIEQGEAGVAASLAARLDG